MVKRRTNRGDAFHALHNSLHLMYVTLFLFFIDTILIRNAEVFVSTFPVELSSPTRKNPSDNNLQKRKTFEKVTCLFSSDKDFLNLNERASLDTADQVDARIDGRQLFEKKRRENNSGDLIRLEKSTSLLRLAKLSLQDYEWRNGFFKKREANRRVEESLARMMGDEPSYVRPMDASEQNIGPLGLLEKSSVEWLRNVIDEEARRAREIVRLGGILVRPMDAFDQDEQLGPLGIFERRVVDFLENIRQSERERSDLKVMRPKDLEASKRGPMGEAELRASEAIREILNSERMRMQRQSMIREGIVRPIDIPGPIGDLEMAVLEVVNAEEQRKMESDENPDAVVIRPMNAKNKGPLGELEEQAIEAVKRLTDEEKTRLRSIQRYLDENRPMQQVEPSALGIVETVVVGIIRAPILLFQILVRVRDLLQSKKIDNVDIEIILNEEKKANPKHKH